VEAGDAAAVQVRREPAALPYAFDALQPFVSAKTLRYHVGWIYGRHLAALNRLVRNTEYESMPLDEIVRRADGAVLENAAEVWNHEFLWRSMTPGGAAPDAAFRSRLEAAFGSLDALKDIFRRKAAKVLSNGWIWLVEMPNGHLLVLPTSDAMSPLRIGGRALLACDLWEHAYYLDYHDDRKGYVEGFWRVANWRFAASNAASG